MTWRGRVRSYAPGFLNPYRAEVPFTAEQTAWLQLMKNHIASSGSISREDFEYAELADKGGLQRAWGVFGKELDGLMDEMNGELVA